MKICIVALLTILLLVQPSVGQSGIKWAPGSFNSLGSGGSSSLSSRNSSSSSSFSSSGSSTQTSQSSQGNPSTNMWVQAVDQVLTKSNPVVINTAVTKNTQVVRDTTQITGGYSKLANFQTNAGFQKADDYVRSHYNVLANADVVSVDAQIVAGTNYRIVYQV